MENIPEGLEITIAEAAPVIASESAPQPPPGRVLALVGSGPLSQINDILVGLPTFSHFQLGSFSYPLITHGCYPSPQNKSSRSRLLRLQRLGPSGRRSSRARYAAQGPFSICYFNTTVQRIGKHCAAQAPFCVRFFRHGSRAAYRKRMLMHLCCNTTAGPHCLHIGAAVLHPSLCHRGCSEGGFPHESVVADRGRVCASCDLAVTTSSCPSL